MLQSMNTLIRSLSSVFVEDELIFCLDEDIEAGIDIIDVQKQKLHIQSTTNMVKCHIQKIQDTYKRGKLRFKKPNTPQTVICGFGRNNTKY